jgi:hypothetical protein
VPQTMKLNSYTELRLPRQVPHDHG